MSNPQRPLPRIAGFVFDWITIPALLIWIIREPNFAHGFINYNESGQHLALIHELKQGRLLFRDLFAQYGVLHYYVPAWAFAVFGSSVATLRGYFLAGEMVSLLAAFVLARSAIVGRSLGALAGVVLVIESHHPFWSTRWGGFRFAFIYLALFALIRANRLARDGRGAWLFAAGASSAIAYLHTYDAGFVSLVGGIVFFLHAAISQAGTARIAKDLFGYLLGLGAVIVPFVWALVAAGTFDDYLAQLPLSNPGRAWLQPVRPGDLTATVMAPAFIYCVSFGILVMALIRRNWDSHRHLPLLLLTTCGGLLYAGSFRAIRGPQFETSLPLAVITAFLLLAAVFDRYARAADDPSRRVETWGSLAVIALAFAAFVFGEIRTYQGGALAWARYQSQKQHTVARHIGTRPLDENYRAIAIRGGGGARLPRSQADQIERLVGYLGETWPEEETLFGYPDLGIFNYFTGRRHITRFMIPVLADADPEWAAEILADLEREQPRVVLMSTSLGTLARATGRREEYLPEVMAYLLEYYEPRVRDGGIAVFERKDAGVRSGPEGK